MTAIFRKLLSKKKLAECESVVAKLVPELAGRVYCVNLPVEHPDATRTIAFAAAGRFSYAIYDAIKAAHMWKGHHAAIVFCRRLRPIEMYGTLLHEMGHLLPYTEPPTPLHPSDQERAAWEGFVAARLTRGYLGESPSLPAWFEQHGLAFIRRVLHLHHRAWSENIEVGLPELSICGQGYDLSPPYRYMHALADEPARMRNAEFAEIEATTAPAEFYQLFTEDFMKWCRRSLCTKDEREKANAERT